MGKFEDFTQFQCTLSVVQSSGILHRSTTMKPEHQDAPGKLYTSEINRHYKVQKVVFVVVVFLVSLQIKDWVALPPAYSPSLISPSVLYSENINNIHGTSSNNVARMDSFAGGEDDGDLGNKNFSTSFGFGASPTTPRQKTAITKKIKKIDYNPFFINVSEIALHWGLEGSPRIMQLLTEMANNPLPDQKKSTVSVLPAFQSDKEFVYFHHIMKTGGTSFSEVLSKIYGSGARDNSVNDSGDFDVLPKSRSSEFMDFTGLKNIIDHKQQSSFSSNNTRPHHNFRFLVGYSHSGYKPVAKFLQENNLVKIYNAKYYLESETSNITQSQRRLRLITFIRDPLDIRASSMAMAMCGLNGLLRKKNITSPNCGQEVNISEIIDFGLEQVKLECMKTSGNKMVRRGGLHATCEKLEKGIDPKPYCRSANALLHSETYNKWCSNIMEDVVDEYIKDGPVHKMEEYALKTFGKPLLPSLSSVTGFTSKKTKRKELHDADIPPRDYIFFGITERMKDTMCLFFYTFRASPPKEVLQEGDLSFKRRVMSCKTNSWWTQEDRAMVLEREKPDYAMWRSANVVMDIWLERVRREIIDTFFDGNMKAADLYMSLDKSKQRERKVLPDYIAPGCFGLSDRGKI